MRGALKRWLLVAAALILLGAVLFTAVMMGLKWDFGALSTVQYDTEAYAVGEAFDSISIVTDFADVALVVAPLTENTALVECYERVNVFHTVAVIDGVLTIEVHDTREWYEHIDVMNFESPRITVCLPEGAYKSLSVKGSASDVHIPAGLSFEAADIAVSTGDVECLTSVSGVLKIEVSTGDITVASASVGALELVSSTGCMTLSDVDCAGTVRMKSSSGKSELRNVSSKNLILSGTTGDAVLQNVIASESFLIERKTGDVKFNGCDAADIVVRTSTGDVTGGLLSEKSFDVHSNTGKVSVPENQSGGRCKIDTDTGDILITTP